MPIDVNDPGFFRLMQLASPALPVGSFSWSQGLEAAVESGWVTNATQAESWIRGMLTHSFGRLDVPVMLRLHDAWSSGDRDAVCYWNAYLYASRSSREFRIEDVQMGQALARLLLNLDLAEPDELAMERPSYAALFALAAVRWRLDALKTAGALVWSFLENQVAAAVKLVPLGQSAGHRILTDLCSLIPHVLETAASLPDGELGALAPSASLLSALHETQHSRLFRS